MDFKSERIEYQKDDNCFTWLSDYEKAQQAADDLDAASFIQHGIIMQQNM